MVITFFLYTFKKIIVYVPFLPFRADQSKLIPLIEFIKAIPISKGYISFIYFCTHPIIKLLFLILQLYVLYLLVQRDSAHQLQASYATGFTRKHIHLQIPF